MGTADEPHSSEQGRRSKVARLLDEYELDGFGEELERLWTAEENRRSLRDLADMFNQTLLEQELKSARVKLLDGEVENIYRLLTTDDVSSAERTRVRRRLEREGVDVERLESAFVTYQAMRTYLKTVRGAEYESTQVDSLEREIQNIQQLRGRTAVVTEGKLEQLRTAGEIALPDFRTLVNIQVVCQQCNTQSEVLELLERGGCECSLG